MPKPPHLLGVLALLAFVLPAPAATPTKSQQILMIGDSLACGAFGSTLQELLIARHGAGSLAFYASCGSSPEHWLAAEPVFVTRCGYREKTASTSLVREYENGRRPTPTGTPKIERLLAKHRPQVVIVQLGTNWMDDFVRGISDVELKKKAAILDRLAIALRGKQVIWVLPPDAPKFSKNVQGAVRDLILRAAKRYRFDTIESAKMTRYVRGRTGSDGVHYNGEHARSWAQRVMEVLRRKVPTAAAPRIHFS